MSRRKQNSTPKIKPWPGSTFSLKIERAPAPFGNKHLWVYLERRAPGKYGRLEAMHAIIPTRKRLKGMDKFFGSARYKDNMWEVVHRVIDEAGVPEEKKRELLTVVAGEYPRPTPEELFLEDLEGPWLKAALGDRKNELSYFKTGKPEITDEDRKLIKECFKEAMDKMRKEPGGPEKVINFIMRGPFEIGL
ncbi:MAG: hypothetical protein LHV69_07620 [Elusimicrobia bacterium]|nr:hypothetical protein [Candidatus Obscuribacterium magneticum]